MQEDKEVLTQLNIEIGEAESRGDIKRLAEILAPELAFRRANGQITNGLGFLQGVKKSDERTTKISLIEIYGDRAFVRCLVTMKTATGDKVYHNLRLFVRHETKWKLMAWANEPV